jgi:hypothetical protein
VTCDDDAEPPTVEQMTVTGSYRLFRALGPSHGRLPTPRPAMRVQCAIIGGLCATNKVAVNISRPSLEEAR